MRVVCSFVGGWGHAEPLLPLAALAQRHGHRVSFAGQSAVRDRLVRLGHEVDVVGPDTLGTTPQALVPVDRDAEREVMRDHFVAGFGRARAAALGALFDREHVGLVVCDEVDVGAVVAAEQRGIPSVTVDVIAAGLLTAPAVVGSAWDELRRDHGLAPDPQCVRLGGAVAVAPLPRSFRSPAATTHSTMRFVRPQILDDVRRVAPGRGGRPLVYVTLGTVFNIESGDLLPRLVEAMNLLACDGDGDVDAEVVITTGPNVPAESLPPRRSGVRVEAFVPQRELLGRCAAVVCHGGSGTLVAALSLGIPAVVLPMGADQPDNADRCAQLGVGVALDPLTASPAEIAVATSTVLRDRAFSAAAARLAAEAAAQPALGSVLELADLLGGQAAGNPNFG